VAIRITATRLTGGVQHEHISHLWWVNPANNNAGSSTRAAIVDWVEAGGRAFVQEARTPRSVVAIVTPERGSKYLRTHADGVWNNNLLSLPRQ